MEKIRVLFEKMDVDQSGKLEKKELQELLESIYGRLRLESIATLDS